MKRNGWITKKLSTQRPSGLFLPSGSWPSFYLSTDFISSVVLDNLARTPKLTTSCRLSVCFSGTIPSRVPVLWTSQDEQQSLLEVWA